MSRSYPRAIHAVVSLHVVLLLTTRASAREWGADLSDPKPVTFNEHVAPVLFAHCAECHRPGQAAPFPLLTYTDARKRGPMLASVTESRTMPPWLPDPSFEPLKDERILSVDEIQLLQRWVEQGMPEGDPGASPPLPSFPDGWRLGTPDLTLTMTEPFDIPASGLDINRCFVLPLDLPSDRWVRGIEIRPSSSGVLHHALYFLGSSRDVRARDGKDGQPGFRRMGFGMRGMLGGWAVGATPRLLPDDLALLIPSGTDLVLQLHFHPNGKAVSEQVSIGLYFAEQPPSRNLVPLQIPPLFGAGKLGFPKREKPIKAGSQFTIVDSKTLDHEIELIGVGGHAHYLCTSMEAIATLPDGSVKKLFGIPEWDFNWQGRYDFAHPVQLPAGTRIDVRISYDNSPSNPRNPSDPPVDVGFGEASTDEMGAITFICVDSSSPTSQPRGRLREMAQRFKQASREAVLQSLAGDPERFVDFLMRFDSNGDGALSEEEAPGRLQEATGLIDQDGDGALSPAELREALGRFRELMNGTEDADPQRTTSSSPTVNPSK